MGISQTKQELEFIAKLGLWRDGYQASDPINLLCNYINCAPYRNWENIDQEEVLTAALKRLELLRSMREVKSNGKARRRND